MTWNKKEMRCRDKKRSWKKTIIVAAEIKSLKEENILFRQRLSIALGELALKERINIHLCDNLETGKKINKKLEMQKVEEPSAKATQNNTRDETKENISKNIKQEIRKE